MRAATLLLAMPIALTSLAVAADAGRATEEAPPVAVRTVKERLSSKASDDQRVNDCKVPHDLRGTKSRPDTCRDPAPTAPQPWPAPTSFGEESRRGRAPYARCGRRRRAP